jgi:tetratricopeptide (TPR) repeat protein
MSSVTPIARFSSHLPRTILLLAVACFAPLPADAASPAELKACEWSYPAPKRIAACNRIIDNKLESKAVLIKAYMYRARANSDNNDIGRAYADGEAAIKLDPTIADTFETRAWILDSAGEFDRPIADLTEAIRLEETTWRYQRRADLYRRKGDVDHTTADLERALVLISANIEKYPQSHHLYRSRSELRRELGQIDDALKDFDHYLAKGGDDARKQITDRADIYMRKGALDRAIADYTDAIRHDQDAARNYERRALAHRLRGDFKNAMLDYDHLAKTYSGAPETFIGRGLTYVAMGKPERAIVDFTKALDIFPEDATAYYNRAQAARESGNAEIALPDYAKAIELDPNYAIAFNSRGRAHASLNDPASALKDFDAAIRLDPRLAAAYVNRGSLHRAAGRTDQAIADFSSAILASPESKEFRVTRAVAFAAKGRHADAESDFTAALALDPVYAQAYSGRAAARLARNVRAEALDDANRALLIDGRLASSYLVRAEVFAALGESAKAEADRKSGETVQREQDDEAKRRAEAASRPARVRIAIKGEFPVAYSVINQKFKLDSVVEVRDDRVSYQSLGMQPYTMASGDKLDEKFTGRCDGKVVPDQGDRTVTLAVEKYLVHVELQSRIYFRTGSCKGRYNEYKESFLIDISGGECKFSYRQDRDLTGVGKFDSNLLDLACVAESPK